MYIVALSGQKGYDTVNWISEAGYKSGDLLQDTQGVYLCIGKDIVFPELYTKAKNKPYTLLQGEKIYSHIVSAQTIDIIHWMVQTYFSSYKHVCDLFLPQGIEKKVVQKKSISDQEQSCVIFPDLWTLTQHYPVDSIKEGNAILHGGMSLVQRRKLFWQIRNNEIHTLLATNRGLFFQRHNLKNITIHQASNRAYSAQSDPRFVLQEVAEKMAITYGTKVEYR